MSGPRLDAEDTRLLRTERLVAREKCILEYVSAHEIDCIVLKINYLEN